MSIFDLNAYEVVLTERSAGSEVKRLFIKT